MAKVEDIDRGFNRIMRRWKDASRRRGMGVNIGIQGPEALKKKKEGGRLNNVEIATVLEFCRLKSAFQHAHLSAAR